MNEAKEIIERHAKSINQSMTTEFMRVTISSIVGSSPILDKFSTWLLAGCGATAALMITNVKSIIPFLGTSGFTISISLLILAAVAGLLQKFRAIMVQCFYEFTEKLLVGSNSLQTNHLKAFEELRKEAEEHNVKFNAVPDIDIGKIKNEFSKITPFLLRKKALKNFEKGSQDYLHGWRKMAGSFKWQVYYLVLQVLFFMIFLLVAAISVQSFA